jgi:hypothetical protein
MDEAVQLITRGNSKLGKGVFVTSLPAGESCPGATDWCSRFCYAKKGFFTMTTHRNKYSRQLALLRSDPGAYEAQLRFELSKLKTGSVMRFHVAGDIDSVEHIGIIARAISSRPDIQFYLYTRSWRVAELREAIERQLFPLANLHVWGSTDPSCGEPPEGWRSARVFDSADDARAGGYSVVCPEQLGRKASCSECQLCWHAKPNAKLAFIAH